MDNNDIIVLIEFFPLFESSEYKNIIQHFPRIENESDSELENRIYKWLEENGYERNNVSDLRLIYEGNV